MRFRQPAVVTCLTLVMAVLLVMQAAGGESLRTFSVASYNVENLLDVFDDPYSHDETKPPKPREQIEQLAAAIAYLDADVVALQEVENQGVLRAMLQEFLPTAGYDYLAVNTTNNQYGMHLGVISRYPILTVSSYRLRELRLPGDDQTWRFARDVMHVVIELPDKQRLDLFNVHFKSRHDLPDDPQSARWRLAEATKAHRLAGKPLIRDPQAWVIVAGDFNDTPDAPGLQRFVMPVSEQHPRWVDAHDHLPAEKRVTYLRAPYRSTIDYILVSPALGPHLLRQRSFVLTEVDLLGGSDHAPLVARFRLD